MKLTRLKIEKLFGIFDYDIKLDNPEGLTILTAPNGFGKSTILRIIESVKLGKFYFEFGYKNIEFIFDEINFFSLRKEKIEDYVWGIYGQGEYYANYLKHIIYPENVLKITEEKLFNIYSGNYQKDAIEVKKANLQQEMRSCLINFYKKTSDLEADFLNRLIQSDLIITEDEFNVRYNKVIEKQKKLRGYQIIEKIQESPAYNTENAKTMSIYLVDMEEKYAVFDGLLKKIELFEEILNNRRFFLKKIFCDKNDGFKIINSIGKTLGEQELSSGEMHEIVMWFTLIFETQKDTLVLIDEPETSLHVSWQRTFLDDIFEIIRLNNIQVIIATHSPQIIGNHWDLVQNLEAPEEYLQTLKNE